MGIKILLRFTFSLFVEKGLTKLVNFLFILKGLNGLSFFMLKRFFILLLDLFILNGQILVLLVMPGCYIVRNPKYFEKVKKRSNLWTYFLMRRENEDNNKQKCYSQDMNISMLHLGIV